MKVKVFIVTVIICLFCEIATFATTIMGVIGKKKIFLVSDSRLTISRVNGEKSYKDDGKKIFKLINGVGVAFAGDSYSFIKISSGKTVDIKSVNTLINDINSIENFEKFTLNETVEIIAQKYVNILPEYKGEILIAGFQDGQPLMYGVRASKGNAIWKGVKGQGSFWAIGSGCNVMLEMIKTNLECDSDISNRELGLEYIARMSDKELQNLLKQSMTNVIDKYKTDYREEERTTGGEVDILVLSK